MKTLISFLFLAAAPFIAGAICPSGYTATTDVVLVCGSCSCPPGYSIASGVSPDHFVAIGGDSSKGNWGNSFSCTGSSPHSSSLTRVCRK